jgi:cephalosporin-C deacetylase
MPDVPFMANFERAVEITDVHPYEEIAEYCRLHPERIDTVFETLSYLDVVNHSSRITCPGLFAVGLADKVTPPSTVFAAYNHYAGSKDIEVYPFNGHEGGGTLHFEKKVAWIQS